MAGGRLPGGAPSTLRLLCAILAACLLAPPFFHAPALAAPSPRVLILNSYHSGHIWTDEEVRGELDILKAAFPEVEPSIEYMDMKRFPSGEHLHLFQLQFEAKYQTTPFDVILTNDNAALDFALRNKTDLFLDAPIVFCGVNGFAELASTLPPGVTGVAEDADPTATIQAALTLHPDARTIYVINDQTSSGRRTRHEIESQLRLFKGPVTFSFLDNTPFPALLDTLRHASPESLVYMTYYNRDPEGRYFTNEEAVDLVTKNSPVPVYHSYLFAMDRGIAGGYLIDAHAHAGQAAALAVRILNGEPVESISPQTQSVTLPIFDWRVLKRFDLNPDLLPKRSVFRNKPAHLLAAQGPPLWVDVMIVAFLGTCVCALIASILIRRRTEAHLLSSERKYRTLIETTAEGYCLCDITCRILEVNDAMCRLLGRPREALIGRSPCAFMPDGDYEDLRSHCTQPSAPAHSSHEVSLHHADGYTVATLFHTTTLLNTHNEVTGCFCLVTDISDQKEATEEFARLQEDLETLVDARTRELTKRSQELEDATRQLWELDKLKGALVHAVTQASRSPIASAKGYAELALFEFEKAANSLSGEERPLRLRTVQDLPPTTLWGQFSSLVDEITDLSLIESGRMQWNDRKTWVKDILEQAVRSMADRFTNTSGPSLEVVCASDVRPIMADPDRILQVLLILLDNAFANTHKGRISLETQSENGFVRIAVADTGDGIAPDDLRHLFDTYYSGGPGAGAQPNIGIGLALCKRIVEHYGGRIEAESQPGHGSRFTVLLPALLAQ